MWNTLVLSYNSSSTVYDIPSFYRHHDRSTLQSMLVIIYTRHWHTLHSTGREESPSPHLDSSACCNKKADKQKNTDAMAESHSWRPQSWLGWLEVCFVFMVMWAPVTPEKEIWPPPVQECLGWSRKSQQIVAEVCGRCWAGVELSGGGAPMQDGTVGGWASRG